MEASVKRLDRNMTLAAAFKMDWRGDSFGKRETDQKGVAVVQTRMNKSNSKSLSSFKVEKRSNSGDVFKMQVTRAKQPEPYEIEEEPEEDLIDIEEEADLIEKERMLDYDHNEDGRPKRKDKKAEENKLAQYVQAMSLDSKEQESTQDPEERWEMSREQKKKRKHRVKTELRKLEAMTEAEADQIRELWNLDLNTRWRLYSDLNSDAAAIGIVVYIAAASLSVTVPLM
ncbi:unnamed protein product [Ranitomeya imitator]|uniref:Uncharacterized protein n=1 Tax=Ranitomeya imitator TaxID=111125 RepID=A0ABN9L9W3_9NEOB|nr:unnamed protein product [Ranitomeya imitator]